MQIETIFQNRVKLKSGGQIVIDPTEALVAVDVNSGRSVKERQIEETAYKTNLEAAEEIARQLRLRDLGGLIVIDFIDMKEAKHRNEVVKNLKESFEERQGPHLAGTDFQIRPPGTFPPADPPAHSVRDLLHLPDLSGEGPGTLRGNPGPFLPAQDLAGRLQGQRIQRPGDSSGRSGPLPVEPQAGGPAAAWKPAMK